MIVKRTILARIAVLYILFGAVIVTGVIVSFNRAAFSEGFNVGTQMVANRQGGEGVVIPEVLFDQPVIAEAFPADSLVICQVSKINMRIQNESVDGEFITSLCLSLLATVLYAAIFVVIFLVLSSLLKSIRKEEGFAHRNIALTRLIAILLIVASLLASLASWIDGHIAAKYVVSCKIDTAFSPDFTQLITAVLIFVMAEVFAIGASLSDEQKLTI